MLTLVAFSLIAQNVLHVRWSCDDTGLVGISLVQVVLSVLRGGKLATSVATAWTPHSPTLSGRSTLGSPSLVSMVMRVRCSV